MPSRRRFLALCGAAAAAATVDRALGAKLAPEFELFLDARDNLVEHCIYRVTANDVVLGALRSLQKELGTDFNSSFPKNRPADEELAAAYIGTLRRIADSKKAKEKGLTLRVLVERSVDTYCRTLDEYCEYMDADTARRLETAQKPDYVGIGITFRRTDAGFFCEPFPGSPADLAGITTDDQLLEIDRSPVGKMTLLEISGRLSGPAGSSVTLRLRGKDGVEHSAPIKRTEMSATPLKYEEKAGVVQIAFRRINERAFVDLQAILQTLSAERELVLDFRRCPGGEFDQAVRIAELFLPEKTLIAKLETMRSTSPAYSRNRAPYRFKSITLLQDAFTASGAEIVIAALTAYPELQKVESRGQKSYGKGVTIRPILLPQGGILKVTDSRVYGPKNEFWHGVGLEPSSAAPVE